MNAASDSTRYSAAPRRASRWPSRLLALAAAAPPAAAQNAVPPPTRLESVVVTGVRGAAESARGIRRDAEQIVDSTVAADIGGYPDNNLAESLARLPGVQVRRDSGEANTVLIRGLPNVATLLNGRELFTTTGRYVQLADVPAALLRRVDVYKSQSADQLEGGIAGLVDARAWRPFDFPAGAASLDLRAVYNDKSRSTDPLLAGTLSRRWQTGAGEFGTLLGLSYQRRDFHEERAFNNAPQDQTGAIPAFDGTAQKATGPFASGLIPIEGQRQRSALNASLQWRPNASTELYAEAFTSLLRNDYELDFFIGLPWLGDRASNRVTLVPDTNQVQTVRARNAFTITSTQANGAAQQLRQFAVGGHWNAGPQWRLSSELSSTGSRFDWRNPILDSALTVPEVFVDTHRGGTPHLEYSAAAVQDAARYHVLGFFDRYGRDRGRSLDWRADTEFTPLAGGPINSWEGGVRLTRHRADSAKSFEGNAAAPGGIALGSVPGLACENRPLAGGGPDYGLTRWMTPCAGYLLDQTAALRELVTGNAAPRALDPGAFFQADERSAAAYLKAHGAWTVAGRTAEAVFGLRVVHAAQETLGNGSAAGVYTPSTRKSSYTDLLPSVNLRLVLGPQLVARLAAGKTITRPNFADLNPGLALVAPSVTLRGSGSGGNPELHSVRSSNVDAGLETALADGGTLNATLFLRRYRGYVISRTTAETFGGTTFDVTRPVNADSGTLMGLELGYQQFFPWLPGWLGGLGVQANATWIDGRSTSEGRSFWTPGLSRTAWNLVGLYERAGWAGRLAYNWRSGFVDGYDNGGPGLDLKVRAIGQLDAALSYRFSQTLSAVIEATNLLDATYRDYWKDAAVYPRDTRRYDRSVGLGLKLRY